MHIKRLAMPRTWPLERKAKPWVAKPRGGHPTELSIPLVVLLRDMLKQVANAKEAKKVLQEGKVEVDGKPVKDLKRGIGLFDRVFLKGIGHFSIYLERKKLVARPIAAELATLKPLKVIGKTSLKGGKLQLNLWGGRNLLTKEKVSINDSILVDLKANSILRAVQMAKGAIGLVIKGRYQGSWAEVLDCNEKVKVKVDGKEAELPKEALYLVDPAERR